MSSVSGNTTTNTYPKVPIHQSENAHDESHLDDPLSGNFEESGPAPTFRLAGTLRGCVLPHIDLAVPGRSCLCTDDGVDSVSAMGLLGGSASFHLWR